MAHVLLMELRSRLLAAIDYGVNCHAAAARVGRFHPEAARL
jgi:hypothetical protein